MLGNAATVGNARQRPATAKSPLTFSKGYEASNRCRALPKNTPLWQRQKHH